jgi:hypothetical protein
MPDNPNAASAPGPGIAPGGLAQVGRDRMRRFGRQHSKLELAGEPEELFGSLVGRFAHGRRNAAFTRRLAAPGQWAQICF